MSEIKAVIFDCFGVLYVDAKQSLLETLPPAQAAELADVYQQGNYGLLDRAEYLEAVAAIANKTPAEVEEFIETEHRFNKELGDYIIAELHPHYKIGMLSNIARGWVDSFFDENQLHHLFNEVVLSGEEGITKPHPHIFEIMAKRLDVRPEECIMIDDIAANCEGAEIAGMKAVQFISNAQLISALETRLAA